MKKMIPLFVMIILANFSAVAQNASAETKPMKSTVKPEPAVSSAPAAAPQTLQKSNEAQNTTPVVPGGEFKPRDTRTAMPAARSKEYAEPKPALPNTASIAPVSPEPAKKDPGKTQPKVAEQKIQN